MSMYWSDVAVRFGLFHDRRNPACPDRRRLPRGGRRATDAIRPAAFVVALTSLLSSSASAQSALHFGFDAASLKTARERSMPVTYGSLWAGAWNQRWGWGGIQEQLATAKANRVTPVVHWWYWGEDISPNCVEHGCWDARQSVSKDKATWFRMANELADLIVRVMGAGSQAIVVIETEFNKNGIETYEPFDGYLAAQGQIFHRRQLKVVVSFGNWGRSFWPNFDRAIAAADLLGTMALQSSVRNASTYLSGADLLLDAARYYQATFGKPSFVTDFAFSSYPEPSYELNQDTVVTEIFNRLGEFRAAGVEGMIWRMLSDDPTFDTSNYHGMAERSWGLLRADGTEKLAYFAFLNGMLAESVGSLEAPRRGTFLQQPFSVDGWALDPAAISGTGIDTVQAWAYPPRAGRHAGWGRTTGEAGRMWP